MKIKANGISMNYEITGNGKWLTIVHGAGDNLGMWWNQLPVFSVVTACLPMMSGGTGRPRLRQMDTQWTY